MATITERMRVMWRRKGRWQSLFVFSPTIYLAESSNMTYICIYN
jgi:hypothetical protein